MARTVIETKANLALKIGVPVDDLWIVGEALVIGILISIIAVLVALKVFTLTGVPLLIALILGGPVTNVIAVIATGIIAAVGGTVAAYYIQKIKKYLEALKEARCAKSFSQSIDKVGEYCAELVFYPQIVISMLGELSKEEIYDQLEDNFKEWGYFSDYGKNFVFETCDGNQKNIDRFVKEVVFKYQYSFDSKKYKFVKSLASSISSGSAEAKEIITPTFAKNIMRDLDEAFREFPEPNKKQQDFYDKIKAVLKKNLSNS